MSELESLRRLSERISVTRAQQHGIADDGGHDRIPSAPAHVFDGAARPRADEDGEVVVLGPVARTASIAIVLRPEAVLGIERLGLDVLDLVCLRVLAIVTT